MQARTHFFIFLFAYAVFFRTFARNLACGVQINTAIGKEASPDDIFDYIYGVLHSPSYRVKYKEFLKVAFPRIPYPKC